MFFMFMCFFLYLFMNFKLPQPHYSGLFKFVIYGQIQNCIHQYQRLNLLSLALDYNLSITRWSLSPSPQQH